MRTGGVFEPTRNFSLVNQEIQVKRKNGSFHARFPNVWEKYKLPKIKNAEVYDAWLNNQMQFWQNQLNFAVWCATTGCGISKTSFHHENPMIRSVFRFHAYYQIRRVLSEMSCPLPMEAGFDPLNNGINTASYERICSEFGIDVKSNWRQKYDLSNGMGSYFYNKKFYDWKLVTTKKWSELTNGGNYNRSMKWKVNIHGDAFGGVDTQTDKVLYIEQLFDHDPGITDVSIRKGDYLAAVGSFVDDAASGFTRAGISRINDSIRVYAWAILGSQAQTRSSILESFDTQKQFLSNVEDAINSEVDLPRSIERYQNTLYYAGSKLDFVVGSGLYMLPSNMEMKVGVINNYNNLIQIATEDMKIGVNFEVNDEVVETVDSGDFSEPDEETLVDTKNFDEPVVETLDKLDDIDKEPVGGEPLTHDEKKLSLILVATVLVSLASWALK